MFTPLHTLELGIQDPKQPYTERPKWCSRIDDIWIVCEYDLIDKCDPNCKYYNKIESVSFLDIK